jgi:hypothetical protein
MHILIAIRVPGFLHGMLPERLDCEGAASTIDHPILVLPMTLEPDGADLTDFLDGICQPRNGLVVDLAEPFLRINPYASSWLSVLMPTNLVSLTLIPLIRLPNLMTSPWGSDPESWIGTGILP